MYTSKGWHTYCENAMMMTATSAGRRTTTYTQEQRKLGNGPQNLCKLPNAS
jgi:hypothetical protein